MILLKNSLLLDYLHGQNHDAKLQTETNQIYLILKLIGREFPLFIRVDSDETTLQMIAILPCPMAPKTAPEVSRLLHLLNKEIDLPGFGMDEVAGLVFFRCVLPTAYGKLDKALLDKMMVSIPGVLEAFFPLISAVALGQTSFDLIATKTHDTLKKFSAK